MSHEQGFGASVKRKEDRRFLVGKGRYTDDIVLPDQAHAVFVRSPYAHAGLTKIDTAAASRMPGVLAVLTGEDVAAAGLGGIPCGWLVKSKDGSNMVEPPHPALAHGKARHVGDPVAMVIAATRQQARDAATAVEVDYDVKPAVGRLTDAVATDASLVMVTALQSSRAVG
ncbi:MAG: xanthine dehydrogenase family protein molybdopterin-binding subunit, partial [Kofleriaceae bacterium]